MTPKQYTVKPLEWKGGKDQFGDESYGASVPFCSFSVYKNADDTQWRWSYCADEYYDEGNFDCDSLEHGKRLAEEYWHSRIVQALVEVKE